jgi:hypothetical protein
MLGIQGRTNKRDDSREINPHVAQNRNSADRLNYFFLLAILD